MPQHPWHQVNITYPGPSRADRERHAIAHLAQVIPTAEAMGLIAGWWFIRKGPWRIRYQSAQGPMHHLLTAGQSWTCDIYEPELHAFGGPDAMADAHALFHADSSYLLGYLHNNPASRRENSLLLITALMRAAGLDLEEQGDVWARAAEHRAELLKATPTPDAPTWARFVGQTRTLLLGSPRANRSNMQWHHAFAAAGNSLQQLRERGKLTRGLRAIITKHAIFHWNRIGIPGPEQARLAQAAKEAILAPTPRD